MKRLAILAALTLTGCPTTPTDCKTMCGDRGVLMWHANTNTCICQQNPPTTSHPCTPEK